MIKKYIWFIPSLSLVYYLYCRIDLPTNSPLGVAPIQVIIERNNAFGLGADDICNYVANGILIEGKYRDKVSCTNKVRGNTRTWLVKKVSQYESLHTLAPGKPKLLGSILTSKDRFDLIAD